MQYPTCEQLSKLEVLELIEDIQKAVAELEGEERTQTITEIQGRLLAIADSGTLDEEGRNRTRTRIMRATKYLTLPRASPPPTACMTCSNGLQKFIENSPDKAIADGVQLSPHIYCREMHATTYTAAEPTIIAWCAGYQSEQTKKRRGEGA